nr:hypothetical protein [Bacteroidota bacterium]
FTINTENKELTSFLIKDILVSLLVNYHNDNNTDNLYSLSVTRHRIDKLFESWGYRLVTWQNESLLPFNLDFLFNEEVKLYQHDCNWSQESLCKADKYQDLWANRISIAPLLENEKAA